MCGIVGYTGLSRASQVIVSGLKRVEYRGYDSAGLAVCDPESTSLLVVKTAGRIADLEERLRASPVHAAFEKAGVGIGHTRWATHGEPTEANAHPHVSMKGGFAVVHNGIIENHALLRLQLEKKGFRFVSQTDTEVIAHLIEACYEGDFRAAVAAALGQLEGAYGVAIISPFHPRTLIAARQGSPMVVGVCADETIVASDISALVSHTRQVICMNDGDILVADRGDADIVSFKNVPVNRELTHVTWDVAAIEKNGYEHFTLKEIHEQPSALANAMRGRIMEKDGVCKLSGLQLEPSEISRVDRLAIVACGTSLHAGMVGKYLFEDFAGIPADVIPAAEFRDRNPIIRRDTCVIAISQSGETADTLAAVRESQRKGAHVLGVCNVVGSTLARETGRGVFLHAGPEIGVASTKAFTCQVAVLAMMAVIFGRTRGLSAHDGRAILGELSRLPELSEEVLSQEDDISTVAERLVSAHSAFYIGRGYMWPVALECALKLKEIAYVHAEGYHAAELKHGPIALLDENVPVIAMAPDIAGKSKTLSNIHEAKARKAPVIVIATRGDESAVSAADEAIRIPRCADFAVPVPAVIAGQLLAYHTARLIGCDIDKPRNLAKSVTVE